MYNGVGVSSVRGSGSSGFVQRNVSYVVKKKQFESSKNRKKRRIPMVKSQEILQHEKARENKIKLLRYIQTLKNKGIYDEDQMKYKINVYKEELKKKEVAIIIKEEEVKKKKKQI